MMDDLTTWLDTAYRNMTHEMVFSHLDGFRRSGSGYIARCPHPAHPDQHPSFYMPSGKPYGICLACGHIQTWWAELESRGIQGWQVVEEIARLAGISPPPRAGGGTGSAGAVQEIEEWWQARRQALWHPEGQDVLTYLRSRGYSDDIIQHADIGVRPCAGDPLPCGIQLPQGEEYRLLLPYRSAGGRLVSLAGRRIDSGEPKYKYPSGLARSLLGRHTLRHGVIPVVVEGLMDAVVLEAAGIQGVVALGGAQASQNQIQELRKYPRVVLALDRDEAGEKGTVRLVRALSRAGVSTFVVEWQGAKDPDELYRAHGIGVVKKAIHEAMAGHRWLIRHLTPAVGATDAEREQAIRQMVDFLSTCTPIQADEATGEMASILGISPSAVESEIQRIRQQQEIEKERQHWIEVGTDLQKAVNQNDFDRVREIIQKATYEKVFITPTPVSLQQGLEAIQKEPEALYYPWKYLGNLAAIDRAGLTVVGAATSAGKTTFLMNLFLYYMETTAGKLIFWSGELPYARLLARLIGIRAKVPLSDVRAHIQGDRDVPEVQDAIEWLTNCGWDQRVYIYDAGEDVETFTGIIRELKQDSDVSVVFADYLQQMPILRKCATREQEVTMIAKMLHGTARDTGIPIIAAAQISRANMKYAERPMLSHLRESGGIEQYATNVIGLWNATISGDPAAAPAIYPASPENGWYWIPRDGKSEEAERAMAMALSHGGTMVEACIIKARWRGNVGKAVPLLLDGVTGVISDLPEEPAESGADYTDFDTYFG